MAPQLSPNLMDTTEHIQSRTCKLTLFPHLTDSEFDKACTILLKRFELHGHRQNEWTAVESLSQSETPFLRITKLLAVNSEKPGTSSGSEEHELSEDDDEIIEGLISPRAVIHYDVVLSTSYRVPVLYFTTSDIQHRYPNTMETLYSHVIPPAFRGQARHVDVIGGITVTDHPATNKPVFFVHPCRTAEVMEASIVGQCATEYDYLLIWLGALGKCVGLNVPLSLVDPGQRHD